MRIALTKYVTGVPVNLEILQFLDESSSFRIINEREIAAFERQVDDLTLRLGNMDGEFINFFSDVKAKDRVLARVIEDDRATFTGYASGKDIGFDVNGEYFSMMAFSSYRDFWDRAKKTRINLNFTDYEKTIGYFTLSGVMTKNLITTGVFSDLIRFIDIYDDLGARPIRFYADSADPNIGNNGRYRDLDENTTVAELLVAIMLYYNAEMYIDNDTNWFIMRRRLQRIGSTVHNLDDILRDDRPIIVKPFGSKIYDFVYSAVDAPAMSPPVLQSLQFVHPTNATGDQLPNNDTVEYIFEYRLTYVMANGAESEPSDPVYVTYPAAQYGSSPDDFRGYQGVFRIPAAPLEDAHHRLLYRSVLERVSRPDEDPVYVFHPELYAIKRFNDNLEATYTDGSVGSLVQPLPRSFNKIPISAWVTYDEILGTWGAPIYDTVAGNATPNGEVFNVLPQLRFKDQSNKVVAYSLLDVFAFFGRDTTIDIIRDTWVNLLRTTSILVVPVEGKNFRVGDLVTNSRNIFPNLHPKSNKFVIKRAEIDGVKEESELELVPVLL